MRATGKFTVVLLLVTTPALAADPPLRPARFDRDSSFRELGDAGPYYPDRAARMGARGVVIMDCHVEANRRLTSCQVVTQTNPDFGFEFAAMKMAERGWMKAADEPQGVEPPADGVWRFRVIFDGNRH